MNIKQQRIGIVFCVVVALFLSALINNKDMKRIISNITYIRLNDTKEKIGVASYYGLNPEREKLNKYTAWNIPFNPKLLECASWDYKFGTVLKVTNLKNNKAVIVRVTDRGPAKRLVKEGRIIDLTVKAFSRIADLKLGLIKVKVEVVE